MYMKKLFLLAICLSSVSAWAGEPLKLLRPLNKALFSTPLDQAITRKTFAQLHRTPQVVNLPKAEKALILAHKFIEENNQWPRTVIFRNGNLVPPQQYTLQEKREVELGNLLRNILERAPNVSPQVREELNTLKYNFSHKYLYQSTLDQLNAWIEVNNAWPRNEKEIGHAAPFSVQEQTEINLAQLADNICQNKIFGIPLSLTKQVRQVRAFYQPSYVIPLLSGQTLPGQQPDYIENFQVREAEYPHVIVQRQHNFYFSPTLQEEASFPKQTVNATPDMNPTPNYVDMPKEVRALEEQDAKYAVLVRLLNWLDTYHTWPRLRNAQSADAQTESKLAQDIINIRPAFAQELEKIYKQELPLPGSLALATQTPVPQLLHELEDWLYENWSWPRNEISIRNKHGELVRQVPVEEYTDEEFYEVSLAQRLETFAQYVHPVRQYQWRDQAPYSAASILSAASPYSNPNLEFLRRCYGWTH